MRTKGIFTTKLEGNALQELGRERIFVETGAKDMVAN